MPRRNPNPPTVETAERDRAIAVYLADTTHTFQDAANHFHLSKSTIFDARKRALAAIRSEGADVYKAAHLLEIAALREASWAVLRAHHVHVADGRVVIANGLQILDHKPVLMAVDRLIKLQERESRLLGLDAPTRQTITVLTEDIIDAAIREELTAMEAFNADATLADRSAIGEAPTTP